MFKLNLVTPEKKIVWEQDLTDVSVPGFMGELTILEGHAPLMTTMDAGIVRYRLKNGESKQIAVGWGYCQVFSSGVNILAETAVEKEEIEISVVKDHLKQYQKKLVSESLNDSEWAKTQHEIARLKAEIRLVEDKA